MNKLQLLREDKRKVAIELFEGRCFCCHRPISKIIFQFHHLEYKEGEKKFLKKLYKESIFKHWEYVKKTIYDEPDRFVVVCRYDHSIVSMRTKSAKPEGRITLIRIALVGLLTK